VFAWCNRSRPSSFLVGPFNGDGLLDITAAYSGSKIRDGEAYTYGYRRVLSSLLVAEGLRSIRSVTSGAPGPAVHCTFFFAAF
jgi:hypothetical protein